MELIITNKKGEKFTVLYDAEDHNIVCSCTWSVEANRQAFYVGHTRPNIPGVKLHRLIMGVTDPKIKVDHKNHNGLDNRRCNLRVCTTTQNAQNSSPRKNSTSKYLGVSIRKNGKWVAQIQVNKVKINLGYHVAEDEAAKVYDNAALRYFGEFANLNFK